MESSELYSYSRILKGHTSELHGGSYTQMPDGAKMQLDDEQLKTIWLESRVSDLIRAFMKEFVNKNVTVKTANGWPVDAETVHDAMKALAKDIRVGTPSKAEPAWIFIGCSETLDPDEVLQEVRLFFPGTVNVHCCTSCQGVTTNTGFKTTKLVTTESGGARTSASGDGESRALAIFAIYDPLGSYATIGHRIGAAGIQPDDFHSLLDQAYLKLRAKALDIHKDSKNDDEQTPAPEPLAENLKIWMSGMPGTEEAALESLYDWSQSRFSRTVPVVGGSSADGSIAGQWRVFGFQIDRKKVVFGQERGQGVMFTMIASSVQVFPLFMHPFTPMTQFTARVLSAGTGEENAGEPGGRVIHTLRDAQGNTMAAGTMYHQWCEEHIQRKLMPPPEIASGPMAFSPAVLAASTACPLGVAVARDGDDAYDYRMMHPSGIYFNMADGKPDEDAYMKCFASVESNVTDVVLFKARRGDLLHRLSKLKEQLVSQLDRASGGRDSAALSPDALRARLAGVIMVYCAGCMMAVNSGKDGAGQMRRLTTMLSSCYGGRPFLAYHPFGEQGFYPSKEVNHHGNLMFAALAFSKDPSFEVDESQNFAELITPVLQNISLSGRQDYVFDVLTNLLMLGDEMDLDAMAQIIHTNAINPTLLQEITPYCTRPVNFALKVANMFQKLARQHPLKASTYNKSSEWFLEFTGEIMESTTWNLLNQAQLLDEETLLLGVRMASQINAKQFVASRGFQELMEKVWTTTPDVQEAAQILGEMENGTERSVGFVMSPMTRHYMNTMCLVILVCLQMYTSQFDTSNWILWLCCLILSSSHIIQMLASPTTGFYSIITTIDDLFIVFSHSIIVYRVKFGHDCPRDLDALTMFLHFGNVLKSFTVHPKIGPMIITVFTMMGDIQKVFALIIFFFICFCSSFRSLYRGFSANYAGGDWSPYGLLIDAVWGNQILWSVEDAPSQSLFASLLTGLPDSASADGVGALLILLSILTIPILLLNLMIAMMASSYERVEKDVDVEFKVQFAACTLVARELPVVPLPFNLPTDLWRTMKKLLASDIQQRTFTLEELAEKQLAVTQLVSLWEARRSIAKLKANVTLDQVERVRTQIDGLQDRMHTQIEGLQDKVTGLHNAVMEMQRPKARVSRVSKVQSMISKFP